MTTVELAACAALATGTFAPVEGAAVHAVTAMPVAAAHSLPAHCRIQGTVSATITFELRTPLQWNGKLLMQGCRALCGYHAGSDCDDALQRGYATLTTDTGHVGSPIDVRWARDNPQARTDYAWRAVHLVALTGKMLVTTLTGTAPRRTYHRGCSNGGRQGLLEAERYPDTFDGVIAGAPLVPGDGLLHLIWSARANLDAEGRPILSHGDLVLLDEAVVRACGDEHGVVEQPQQCRSDPFAAEFGRGTPVQQWSAVKRAAVKKIYAGPRSADGSALTAGGPAPGSELAWKSFIAPAGEASLFATLATDYLRYMVFTDEPARAPSLQAFDFYRDVPAVYASARDSRTSGDLRAFAARGGKVIVWHGWADESVVPWNSIAYAHAVDASLGTAAAQAFRLYMLPAVGHCSESPGAGRVDWLTALENWVEHGEPPGEVAGSGRAPRGTAALRASHVPYVTTLSGGERDQRR